MKIVKYGSEPRALRKVEGNFPDLFQRNCPRIVLGNWLTYCISNSRLYEKCGSIPLSMALMRERLRWLGHVVWMKDDKLPKIVLFSQLPRAKLKSMSSSFWVGGRHRERSKGKGTSWEDVKRKSLNRFRWRRGAHSCVSHRRHGAVLIC